MSNLDDDIEDGMIALDEIQKELREMTKELLEQFDDVYAKITAPKKKKITKTQIKKVIQNMDRLYELFEQSDNIYDKIIPLLRSDAKNISIIQMQRMAKTMESRLTTILTYLASTLVVVNKFTRLKEEDIDRTSMNRIKNIEKDIRTYVSSLGKYNDKILDLTDKSRKYHIITV
jgi:hypothetical protein